MKVTVDKNTAAVPHFAMELIVGGKPLTEYGYMGKTLVEAAIDRAFKVRISNNTQRNCEFVLSVDGLSALTGDNASIRESGYVLRAGKSWDIPGWYQDGSEAAGFYFGTPPEGYANRVGNGSNTGIISVAFFFEKQQRQYRGGHPELLGMGATKGGGQTRSMSFGDTDATLESMGGGSSVRFGENVEHRTTEVHFVREQEMAAQISLYHMSRDALAARGIRVIDGEDPVLSVIPFPADVRKGVPAPPPYQN